MYVLTLRDGSRMDIDAPDDAEAMRAAIRRRAQCLEGGGLRAPYQSVELLQALGLGRPGLFDRYGPAWQAPNADEVRELLKVAGLTSSTAGRLVGVPGGKVRKWAGKEPGLQMPYAVWRLLSVYAGAAACDCAMDNEIKN